MFLEDISYIMIMRIRMMRLKDDEVKRGRSGSPTVDLRAAGNLN